MKRSIPSENPPQDPELEIATAVRHAVAAALEKKAADLRVLELAGVTDFTDFFVLGTGANARQVQAIADAVEERLRALGQRPLHVEGYQRGHWVLLDYGDFVVHIFQPEQRRFYGLDKLWADAEEVGDRFLP
jgi:ribosome-associated protein